MELGIHTLSKIGGRKRNEDAGGVLHSGELSFFVLCDGAGGHNGGAVASELAVKHTLATLQKQPLCNPLIIENALRCTNSAILAEQLGDETLRNMRTTVVVLTIDRTKQQAIWGHIGDSRLYYFRNDRIGKQTLDHSVVQRLVDAGYLQASEIRTAPQRNQLFSALGEVNQLELTIEKEAVDVRDGDVFLLCTDGFWECVLESEMEATLSKASSVAGWLSAMEEYVIERGGAVRDNYSAIGIFCTSRNEQTLPGIRLAQ